MQNGKIISFFLVHDVKFFVFYLHLNILHVFVPKFDINKSVVHVEVFLLYCLILLVNITYAIGKLDNYFE